MNFFSREEEAAIINTIRQVEGEAAIEIRIHLETACKEDIYDHAANIFKLLKMHTTKLRSGILFYLALKNKQFVVLGDVGVNQKVEDDYWEIVCQSLQQSFKEGKYAKGLIYSILHCGKTFTPYFPVGKDDTDELPNTLSIG